MTADKSILLSRGFIFYYGGEITKAYNVTNRIYEDGHKSGDDKAFPVTMLILLAQIHFTRKNYQKAL
jgi:hypothetical protein